MKISTLFETVIILLTISSTISLESDLKLAINSNLLDIIKKVPFNELLSNSTFLSEGKSFSTNFIYGEISNVKIVNINQPSSVNVISHDPQNPSVELEISDIEIDLLIDISLNTFFFIKEDLSNSPVKIVASQLNIVLGIDRELGNLFSVQNINIQEFYIYTSFNNFFYEAIAWLFNLVSNFIVNPILNLLKCDLSSTLNLALRAPISENLENILNFSLIPTDYLNIVSDPSVQTTNEFLKDESNFNTFFTYGAHISLLNSNVDFPFKQASPISLNNLDFEHEISLVISDYLVNNVFYIINSLNYANYNQMSSPSTFPEIPYDYTVQGFSQLLPELSTYFKQNYQTLVSIGIYPTENVQPLLKTVNGVSRLSINFLTKLFVVNDPNSFSHPQVKALSLNTTASYELEFGQNGILNITLINPSLDYFEYESFIGTIDADRLKANVNELIVESTTDLSLFIQNWKLSDLILGALNPEVNTLLNNFLQKLSFLSFSKQKMVSGNGEIHLLLDS